MLGKCNCVGFGSVLVSVGLRVWALEKYALWVTLTVQDLTIKPGRSIVGERWNSIENVAQSRSAFKPGHGTQFT
jgi:hypothetical protein